MSSEREYRLKAVRSLLAADEELREARCPGAQAIHLLLAFDLSWSQLIPAGCIARQIPSETP
jgi:hypothetical protein